jgi:1,2-diacylglycerol 3-alpha-glucosyltransferase
MILPSDISDEIQATKQLKIVHLCLSCFYVDGYMYQENILVRQHRSDGHEVVVIASTVTFGPDGKPAFAEPGTYDGTDGAKVTRLPYRTVSKRLGAKIRLYAGLSEHLEAESPDILICHGISGAWLGDVAKYKRAHPLVRIFADNHADFNNSGTSILSMRVLHRIFYRWWVQRALGSLEKVLCISLETMKFANIVYDIPLQMLEFFPLGGVVFDDVEYGERRRRGRSALAADKDSVVFFQSGKFDDKKKLIQAVSAFTSHTANPNFLYVAAGHMSGEIEESFRSIAAADYRISFAGWLAGETLLDFLCAADVYVQPGSQSATMQMSLASRCPILLADVEAHRPYFDMNGWLVRDDSELAKIMATIQDEPKVLEEMSRRSLLVAQRLLDYRVLAARFY